ncbi:MAG: twin-arginine translocase TatA/TatE family subunit [Actinomycetota bacterium]|nr:twin-arginine translocase TatA/TatE family subunit [Actinomycetota bacterium]
MIGDILQPTHLLFVLAIALLVLGPKRLPEVGRSLGRGIRDFRTAISLDDHDHADALGGPAIPGRHEDTPPHGDPVTEEANKTTAPTAGAVSPESTEPARPPVERIS